MAERINVVPEDLRQAARAHREMADHLTTAPADNAAVMSTLGSLGPVFADLREAGAELLEQRRICYEQQAAAHAALAEQLSFAADIWCQHDAEAARALRAPAGPDA